jgi:TolB-like protein/cytochrome c-type biogenesis protein CcmH/NrfG
MSGSNLSPAVFLSYASQDSEVARQIGEALRSAGVEIWLDQDALAGGEAWDAKIRQQIRECVLFVPLISAASQARREGYFRLEWHLAEQRSLLMVKGQAFIVPVTIDGTSERDALVPEAFLAVQWMRLGGEDSLRLLVDRLRGLLMPGAISPPPPPAAAFPPPAVLLARKTGDTAAPQVPDYELVRIIGRGSYGDVWLARGLTGLWRAIKIVWRERFTDAGPFEREFKGLKEFAAISLGDSIQMALLHVGRNDAAGFFYYVMELADDVERGPAIEPASYVPLTLGALRQVRGRQLAPESIRLGVAVARALASLHAHGLVHRDIKPSNIILVGGVPKLADIGLVAMMTTAQTFVGTEGYIPPEGPGAPGADVFALGKVLFELSTGLDRQEFPQLPPELNRLPDRRGLLELNEIILRACDPLPEKRYRDGAALLVDLAALDAGHSLRGRRQRRRVLGAATAAAVMAVGGFFFLRGKNSAPAIAPPAPDAVIKVESTPPPPLTAPEKSLAMLPFANLSAEKDSEYFADGIAEDILTDLSGIKALRVASRTSAQQYRNTKKALPQIARELNVRFILEGSVQRSGTSVRVHGQLIAAATDEQVWAKTYSGDLTRIFELQAEIANDIASALHAVLSPEEKTNLARKPTENLQAYTAYMEGRAITHRSPLGGRLFGAVAKFQQATKLDPNFVEAWASLSYCTAQLYFFEEDHSPERLAATKEAVDHAVRLEPDHPEVIDALGSYYFFGLRDYDRAEEQYARLAKLQPNSATVPQSLALIQSHQGHWVDSVANARRALALDPASLSMARGLMLRLQWVRRYDELETVAARLVHDYPDEEEFYAIRAQNAFNATGSTTLMAEFDRHQFPPDHAEHVLFLRRRLARIRGDYSAAVRFDHEAAIFGANPGSWIQQVPAAISLANAGDLPAAQTLIRSIIDGMTAQATREPNNSLLQAWLGQAYALLEDKDRALQSVQRSLDLMPESLDALFGVETLIMAGAVWAHFGDKERALAVLAHALQTAGGEHVYSARVGAGEAPADISWQPLVDDPRFQALMADPKNNLPLITDDAFGPGSVQKSAPTSIVAPKKSASF